MMISSESEEHIYITSVPSKIWLSIRLLQPVFKGANSQKHLFSVPPETFLPKKQSSMSKILLKFERVTTKKK